MNLNEIYVGHNVFVFKEKRSDDQEECGFLGILNFNDMNRTNLFFFYTNSI